MNQSGALYHYICCALCKWYFFTYCKSIIFSALAAQQSAKESVAVVQFVQIGLNLSRICQKRNSLVPFVKENCISILKVHVLPQIMFDFFKDCSDFLCFHTKLHKDDLKLSFLTLGVILTYQILRRGSYFYF